MIWTQVAQYIILIISYLVPVVYLSWRIFGLPVPELAYGKLLQQEQRDGDSSYGRCQGEGDTGALAEGGRRDRHQTQSRWAL